MVYLLEREHRGRWWWWCRRRGGYQCGVWCPRRRCDVVRLWRRLWCRSVRPRGDPSGKSGRGCSSCRRAPRLSCPPACSPWTRARRSWPPCSNGCRRPGRAPRGRRARGAPPSRGGKRGRRRAGRQHSPGAAAGAERAVRRGGRCVGPTWIGWRWMRPDPWFGKWGVEGACVVLFGWR